MGLDARGDIAIATVVIYVPVALLALAATLRHGFNRSGGWLSLLIFSCVRIAGAIAHIIAEEQKSKSETPYIVAFALEAAGLAPLLTSTAAFVGQTSSVGSKGDQPFIPTRIFRLIQLVLTIAFILSIVGASRSTSSIQSTRNSAESMRKAGSILFAVSYLVIVALTAFCWMQRDLIYYHRRSLLLCATAALPFLLVRLIYSVCSAFSGIPSFNSSGPEAATGSLSAFNIITGKWELYLVMAFLMELIVVLIYLGYGLTHRKAEEEPQNDGSGYPTNDGGKEARMNGNYRQQPPVYAHT